MAEEPGFSDETLEPEARKPIRIGFVYLGLLLVVTIGALLYAGGLLHF